MENAELPQGTATTSKKLRLFGIDLNSGHAHNSNDEHIRGKRKCPFCEKEFSNSQALGGHQNAHKKERLMKRKSQLEERKASIELYIRSLDDQYDSPMFDPFNKSGTKKKPQLLFKPMPQRDECYDKFDLCAFQVYVPYY